MTIDQIVSLCAKEGMGAVAIGAGIWLLWFMIKYTVIRLGEVIDRLALHVTEFSRTVNKDHEAHTERQQEILKQHREITDILRSINNRVK